MKKRRIITFFVLLGLIINSFLFFLTNMNEFVGIITMLWSIGAYFSNNEKWSNRFRENIGIALFSGLLVSIIRDIATKTWNHSIGVMYFIGFATSVILLMKSASKGEDV